MSRILIIDPCCNKPYTGQTLRTQPLGGTEATVIRVAEALADLNEVTVMQHNRKHPSMEEGVVYAPLNFDDTTRYDAVIVLRAPAFLMWAKYAWKDANLVLWLHDLAGDHLRFNMGVANSIVTVSDFHKTHIIDWTRAVRAPEPSRILRIYNPIDADLEPNETPRRANKLVWFSSPHKGLNDALKLFSYARNLNPDLRLYVSNPGYYESYDTSLVTNVVNLGALPHYEALGHVREALCVFYPNNVFPETFGLVMAEANAVGTPVLTHAIGAAREVLSNPEPQIVQPGYKNVVDRLFAWHSGNSPVVKGKDEFRIKYVAREWRSLLGCK